MDKQIKKIKRELIITIVAICILIAVVLFFIIWQRAWHMLFAPFIFVFFLGLAIYMDNKKIKAIKEENENQKIEEEVNVNKEENFEDKNV